MLTSAKGCAHAPYLTHQAVFVPPALDLARLAGPRNKESFSLVSRVLEIGTQQLDFLGNCQCRLNFLDNIMHKETRAQVPIFDTTQKMGYLSIVGTWTL